MREFSSADFQNLGRAPVRARLLPFQALRYNESHPRVEFPSLIGPPGGITQVVGGVQPEPPPYHSSHLFPSSGTKSLPSALGTQERKRLSKLLAGWRTQKILVQDQQPSIYLHQLSFNDEDGTRMIRTGFFALLGLTESGPIEVLPHEGILPNRLERQVDIFEALGAQILPIFLIYSDPDGDIVAQAQDESQPRELLSCFTDTFGQKHQLERIEDTRFAPWLEQQLSDKALVIADGHHRFSSLQEYWRIRRGILPAGSGFPKIPEVKGLIAVYLTSIDAPGCRIRAIPRLVRVLPLPYSQFLTSISSRYQVQRMALESGAPVHAILTQLRQYDVPAFGLFHHGESGWDLLVSRSQNSESTIGTDASVLQSLDIVRLHQEVLRPLGAHDMTKTEIGFEKDPDGALNEVRAGTQELVCFFNAVRPDQIWSVAHARTALPPKATYFFPKVDAGLIALLLR